MLQAMEPFTWLKVSLIIVVAISPRRTTLVANKKIIVSFIEITNQIVDIFFFDNRCIREITV